MRSLITYRPALANIDRWFDSFFEDFARPVAGRLVGGRWPAVDVRETEAGYHLEADLPGLTEKDFEVKVDGNLLTIASKQEDEQKTERDGYVVRERRAHSFSRSFVLPKEAETEGIDASFKNGVLTLEIPKAVAAQPKQIEVKA